MIQILRNKKSLTKLWSPASRLCREAVQVPLSAYTAGQESFNSCSSPSDFVEKAETPTMSQTGAHAISTIRHPAGQILPWMFKMFLNIFTSFLMRVSSWCNANGCAKINTSTVKNVFKSSFFLLLLFLITGPERSQRSHIYDKRSCLSKYIVYTSKYISKVIEDLINPTVKPKISNIFIIVIDT